MEKGHDDDDYYYYEDITYDTRPLNIHEFYAIK